MLSTFYLQHRKQKSCFTYDFCGCYFISECMYPNMYHNVYTDVCPKEVTVFLVNLMPYFVPLQTA